jgi:hypothetical protein
VNSQREKRNPLLTQPARITHPNSFGHEPLQHCPAPGSSPRLPLAPALNALQSPAHSLSAQLTDRDSRCRHRRSPVAVTEDSVTSPDSLSLLIPFGVTHLAEFHTFGPPSKVSLSPFSSSHHYVLYFPILGGSLFSIALSLYLVIFPLPRLLPLLATPTVVIFPGSFPPAQAPTAHALSEIASCSHLPLPAVIASVCHRAKSHNPPRQAVTTTDASSLAP